MFKILQLQNLFLNLPEVRNLRNTKNRQKTRKIKELRNISTTENNMQKDNIVKKVSLRGTRNIDESQMQTGTKDLQRGNATLSSMSERGVNSENSWRRFQVAHERGGDHRKIL